MYILSKFFVIKNIYVLSIITVSYSWRPVFYSLYYDDCFIPRGHENVDLTDLDRELDSMVYGQPFVMDKVVNALEYHLNQREPRKPLVFSFHGSPGIGKSFVASIIAKHMFGSQSSPFVRKYHAKKHFPEQDHVETYKVELQRDFEVAISKCAFSLFIFDEVDKYPPGLLDCVKPYIDYTDNVNGRDYRKAVFIFLTNSGQKIILQNALNLYKHGIERKDFRIKTFEQPLKKGTLKDEGGFYQSELIQKHLIDFHIPFLPLEMKHVGWCFMKEFTLLEHSYKDYTEEITEAITNDIYFGPETNPIFAVSGCKGVSEKVGVIIERRRWEARRKHEL